MKQKYNCKFCFNDTYTCCYSNIADWEYSTPGNYSYYQCNKCLGIQLHPFPNLSDLIDAYNIEYHGYRESEKRGPLFRFLYNLNLFLLNRSIKNLVNKNSIVLDIGCGCGQYLEVFKNLGINNLYGIDFNLEAVDKSRKKGINVFHGTFKEFQHASSSFDLIIMNNYLEHTLDPIFELSKSYDLLKKSGNLVGEIPGFDSFERILFKRFWGGNHVPRHTFQFTKEKLYTLLKNTGFSQIKIYDQLNSAHLALSIQNYIVSKLTEQRKREILQYGRISYFNFLLLATLPISIIPYVFKNSGVVRFSAKKI